MIAPVRTALAALVAVLPLPLAAACDAPSLLDRLSASERAAFEDEMAQVPHSEGLVWEGTRGDDRITLVGTLHLPDPRLSPILELVRDDIRRADLVLLEMTPAEEAQMQDALAEDPSLMFVTDGPTLPERLDAATWEAVVEAARARGIPPFLASKFRPWFLSMTLSMPACAMPELSGGAGGLDHQVMEAAEGAGVPMAALEPWDTIFGLFRQGSEEEELDLLRLSLLAPDIQGETMAALLDGYFAGRTAELWHLSRLAMDFLPQDAATEAAQAFELTEEVLLVGRNRAWMPVIEAAAHEHDRLVVAAGAAHLPGEDGLVSLLEGAGWTLTPRQTP